MLISNLLSRLPVLNSSENLSFNILVINLISFFFVTYLYSEGNPFSPTV